MPGKSDYASALLFGLIFGLLGQSAQARGDIQVLPLPPNPPALYQASIRVDCVWDGAHDDGEPAGGVTRTVISQVSVDEARAEALTQIRSGDICKETNFLKRAVPNSAHWVNQ